MAAYKARGNDQPLFTVTQGSSIGTFTVSGLRGDGGRLYRLVWHITCSSAAVSTQPLSFNGIAAQIAVQQTVYNIAGVAVTAVNAGLNGVIGQNTRGETLLYLKTGVPRIATSTFTFADVADLYTSIGRSIYTTTTGEITSVALSLAAGTITAGSTCDVYDHGVAR